MRALGQRCTIRPIDESFCGFNQGIAAYRGNFQGCGGRDYLAETDTLAYQALGGYERQLAQ